MKTAVRATSFSKLFIFLFSALAVSLTSCLDNNDMETPEPMPAAYVSLYHGAPNAPDLDIILDNQRINSQAFKYSTYSEYLNFKPGSRKIKFTPANAANAFVDTTVTFKENNVYSLFTINRLQEVDLLMVKDSIQAPGTGKAAIRVVHLSPDAPVIDVSTGTPETSIAANLNFKGHTMFMDVATGTQTVKIKKAGTSEVLLTVADFNLESGRSYSLIVRGFVTPPAGNTNVLSGQIIKNF